MITTHNKHIMYKWFSLSLGFFDLSRIDTISGLERFWIFHGEGETE